MKKFVITTMLFGMFVFSFGQQQKVEPNPHQQLDKINVNSFSSLPTEQAIFSHTLPNGDKVYSLPQDRMSCVVLDMSRYNYHMPVGKSRAEDKIPNATPVIPFIPKEKERH